MVVDLPKNVTYILRSIHELFDFALFFCSLFLCVRMTTAMSQVLAAEQGSVLPNAEAFCLRGSSRLGQGKALEALDDCYRALQTLSLEVGTTIAVNGGAKRYVCSVTLYSCDCGYICVTLAIRTLLVLLLLFLMLLLCCGSSSAVAVDAFFSPILSWRSAGFPAQCRVLLLRRESVGIFIPTKCRLSVCLSALCDRSIDLLSSSASSRAPKEASGQR